MEYLTVEILDNLKKVPCVRAMRAFREKFGTKARIEDIITWLEEIGHEDWLGWILAQTLEITGSFLEHGADVHADHDYPLRCAAGDGHLEVVKLLFEHGADVHAGYDNAFYRAAGDGHLEVVKFLKECA